jgi:hypothetical protein
MTTTTFALEDEPTFKNNDEIERYYFNHYKFSCLFTFLLITIFLCFLIIIFTLSIIILRLNKLHSFNRNIPLIYGFLFVSGSLFFVSVYIFKWYGKEI